MPKDDDQPYCKECGYLLVGLTESSKCPECGRPIVDVLVRDSFPGAKGRRYQSRRRLWGLPLIAIASGPYGMERDGRAVGVIALGDRPKGVIALGGAPLGVIAVGGFARGIVALGGFSLGLVSLGGFAAGLLAFGGFAGGLYAIGGRIFVFLGGIGGKVTYLWPF